MYGVRVNDEVQEYVRGLSATIYREITRCILSLPDDPEMGEPIPGASDDDRRIKLPSGYIILYTLDEVEEMITVYVVAKL
ncbi:MAG: type II toxin-antitoxin system RelE/ParE family toxin [Anaerolineae bacterium]